MHKPMQSRTAIGKETLATMIAVRFLRPGTACCKFRFVTFGLTVVEAEVDDVERLESMKRSMVNAAAARNQPSISRRNRSPKAYLT